MKQRKQRLRIVAVRRTEPDITKLAKAVVAHVTEAAAAAKRPPETAA